MYIPDPYCNDWLLTAPLQKAFGDPAPCYLLNFTVKIHVKETWLLDYLQKANTKDVQELYHY